jgi:hypothetical protein
MNHSFITKYLRNSKCRKINDYDRLVFYDSKNDISVLNGNPIIFNLNFRKYLVTKTDSAREHDDEF